MADEQVVNQESPDQTPLAEAIASSPEVKEEVAQQVQEAQTPTAEQGVTQETEVQEEARIPYSRFKEKVDEANWLKQQLENQQRLQQPIQQPVTLPEEMGNTPEEREFWRLQRRIAREEAEKVQRNISPMLEAGVRELTNMKVQQFRTSHPDIKSNSQEENEIAERIKVGYTPDDAYWSVMGPRGIRVAQEQGKQQVKQQIAAKRQANVESASSIPIQAQPKPKMSFRQEMEHNMKLAEEGKL